MGKWITRCLEKNTDHIPISDTDSVDIVETELEQGSKGSVSHPPALDHLTKTERQAYEGWYGVMVGEKFNMSEEEAHAEAMKLLIKTSRILKIEQATRDYELDGYLKIFSTKLNRNIYLARDKQVKKRLPDKSLQVFTENEIQALKGLSHEEQLLILEAKALLNFHGVIASGVRIKKKLFNGEKCK